MFLPVVVAAVRYGLDGACVGLGITQLAGIAIHPTNPDIAYVAAGSDIGIAKTVLLSPGVNPQLDGSTVANFKPFNVLGIASSSDQPALDAMMATVQEPKKATIASSSAHGVALLQSAEVFNAVRQWLVF